MIIIENKLFICLYSLSEASVMNIFVTLQFSNVSLKMAFFFFFFLHLCTMGLKFLELDFTDHNLNGDHVFLQCTYYVLWKTSCFLLHTQKDE